ncbi:allergen Tha p 1 [Ptiloglossa arizonensis]|uniref:allergen Tha p 1 n=1 Tax=Ptiloglossa arizonensis TaxID=3350558 RepID=UPI003F9F64E6
MKVPIILILSILVLANFVKAQDISNLLRDKRFVEKQIACILNRGRCDFIGKKIKGLLPEALHNNCRGCTFREREHARTLIEFMKRNYPREWHSIVRQYEKMYALQLKSTMQ